MMKPLLPLLLAATAALSHAAPDDKDRSVPQDGPVEFWRMEVPNAWGVRQPMERVIRTRAEFEQVWDQIWQGFNPLPRFPQVDFAKEAVVVLAMGVQPSSGYRLRTDSVTLNGNNLDVVYTTMSPGTGCVTTNTMTAPLELLRFNLPAPQVRFRARPQVVNCR